MGGFMRIYFFNCLLTLSIFASTAKATNLTDITEIVEKKSGEDIVMEAIEKVTDIFLNTNLANIPLFLKRIAKAESNFGKHPGTYRRGYFGGIWQVDKAAFKETQNLAAHPNFVKLHAAIRNKFSWDDSPVEWTKVKWQNCTIPTFSCVAARLYLAAIPERVPGTLEGQAHYWKKHYNTAAGAGTIQHFIEVNKDEEDDEL